MRSAVYRSPVSWLTDPDSEWERAAAEPDEPPSRLRFIALLVGVWLAVSVLALVILLVVNGKHGRDQVAGSATATTKPSASASSSGIALPAGWTRQASDQQTNCAAHAYGQVAAFFARTPCTSVQRLLATTAVNGRPVVVASNVVTFADASQASSYLHVVNADGTGNISDLLREGVRYPGGPDHLPTAAFASRQVGSIVRVAEAAWASGTPSGTDPALLAVAKQGV